MYFYRRQNLLFFYKVIVNFIQSSNCVCLLRNQEVLPGSRWPPSICYRQQLLVYWVNQLWMSSTPKLSRSWSENSTQVLPVWLIKSAVSFFFFLSDRPAHTGTSNKEVTQSLHKSQRSVQWNPIYPSVFLKEWIQKKLLYKHICKYYFWHLVISL